MPPHLSVSRSKNCSTASPWGQVISQAWTGGSETSLLGASCPCWGSFPRPRLVPGRLDGSRTRGRGSGLLRIVRGTLPHLLVSGSGLGLLSRPTRLEPQKMKPGAPGRSAGAPRGEFRPVGSDAWWRTLSEPLGASPRAGTKPIEITPRMPASPLRGSPSASSRRLPSTTQIWGPREKTPPHLLRGSGSSSNPSVLPVRREHHPHPPARSRELKAHISLPASHPPSLALSGHAASPRSLAAGGGLGHHVPGSKARVLSRKGAKGGGEGERRKGRKDCVCVQVYVCACV